MLTTYTIPSNNPTAPPVVLLHAFPLSSAMWTPSITLLAEREPGRDYHTIEFPGFGAQEGESDVIPDWTMEQFAGQLKTVLDGLDVAKAVIAGISLGGYAAFAFYRAFPNRVHSLILSNTQAAADSVEAMRGREEFVVDVQTRGSAATSERMLPKFLVPQVLLDQPDLKGKLEYWIHDAKPSGVIAALRAMAARADSTDLLRSIRVPTLAIAGSEDAFFSVDSVKAWSAKIPNSEFALIEGAGHLSPLDYPLEWSESVIQFLHKAIEK